jgi:YVTN family beta-propeller protein
MDLLQPDDPKRVGPFRLVGRLGSGGMGEVYLGRDGEDRAAAVKVIHSGLASDPGFRSRFAREIDAARRVRSPWTVDVLAADPNARRPWLATDYIPGPSLHEQVEQSGPLPEQATVLLAGHLARAVADLHAAGVVHRDLKPSNVLLGPDGPRLIDFGIARATDATKITLTGVVIGTPAFMSPEQAQGDEAGTPSDVFSLAAVLTYAATGKGPFGNTSTPVAMLMRIANGEPDISEVPTALRPHLETCLAKNPLTRPTAAALAAALGSPAHTPLNLPQASPTIIDNPGGSAAGSRTGMPRPDRPNRSGRHPLLLPLAALGGLAAAAMLATLLATSDDEPPAATTANQPATPTQQVACPGPAGTGLQRGRVPVGFNPQGVVVTPDGARAYSHNSRDISVIDVATCAVVKRIGLEAAALAVSPDGRRLYAPQLSGDLSVIDTETNSPIASIPTTAFPESVAVAPDGRAVYIVHDDRESQVVSLTIVDTASNTVAATVPIGPSHRNGIDMFVRASPDSETVWVGGGSTGSVMVIDTASRSIVATIPEPRAVTIAFAGDRAYMYRDRVGVITVIDTTTRTVLKQFRTDSLLGTIAVAPNGRYVYGARGSEIDVIDTETGSVVDTIALDRDGPTLTDTPDGLAVAPDGRTLFVTAFYSNAVLVADTTPYA